MMKQFDPDMIFKIIIILLGSYTLNYILRGTFRRIFTKVNAPKTRTVLQVSENGVTVFIIIIAVLMTLATLNINIMPLLASAGVLGFAVGFGSQSLIKDVITGLFLLTDNIFYEGDVIRIASVEGKVEKVGIRSVTIRDKDGVVHTIPNGTITTVANFTKEWSIANIAIGISNDDHIDTILDKLKDELHVFQTKATYAKWIIGKPTIEGITAIEGAKTTITVQIKTSQAKKYEIENAFRYHLKKRFEKEKLKFA